ncbi:MAG TPA: AMP-binding protein [Burkholderiales bacterium]|nr:AMP-binding protein [Burkholderiales bacterium]
MSYEQIRSEFSWQVPAQFNFAADVVDRWAKDPAKLALVWCDEAGREERFTFERIAELSRRAGSLLRASGLQKGDRCIVMLPRLPQWQLAMLGCLRLGVIPVPCIDMLTAGDLRYRAEHSGAVGVITTHRNVSKFEQLKGFKFKAAVGGGEGWLDFDRALAAASPECEPARVAAEDPVAIYYTSGSSGHPKGVTHAARALWAWRYASLYWQDLKPSDLMWCTADTGWSKAGTAILFGPWSCGAAVLFYDGPFDPQRRLALLARQRVSVFCAAATELRRLINEDVSPYDLSALRLAVSAGETVNPEIVRRWQALTGVPLLDGYGQTETLMTVLNYPFMPVKPGSMGRPQPGIDSAIIDGQLAIRLPNPQMMLGYWRDPERSAAGKTRHRGAEYWLTGDVVRQDEEGYLYYEGRADDIISSAGYRIGPLEVESALLEHPAVQESAAVGKPDARRGEIVKAFVVLKAGYAGSPALAAELQEHVKRVTAPYKYPREIEFVGELPKNASGKLLRRLLRSARM